MDGVTESLDARGGGSVMERGIWAAMLERVIGSQALWYWSHRGWISKKRHGAKNVHSRHGIIHGGSRRQGHYGVGRQGGLSS